MRIIVIGVSVTLFFVAIASAAAAMVFQGRNDEITRFNSGVVEARALFSQDISSDKKDAELKRLVSLYLAIGESSRDPNIRSAAYFQAGFLLLLDYDPPSSATLQGALGHLSEAARICGDQKDRDACFFSEIQTNLDYARSLWQEARARTGSDPDSQVSKQGKEPPKPSAGKKTDGSLSGNENREEQKDGMPGEQKVIGSVRGAHSKEPQAPMGEDDFFGAGSGFRISANKP